MHESEMTEEEFYAYVMKCREEKKQRESEEKNK